MVSHAFPRRGSCFSGTAPERGRAPRFCISFRRLPDRIPWHFPGNGHAVVLGRHEKSPQWHLKETLEIAIRVEEFTFRCFGGLLYPWIICTLSNQWFLDMLSGTWRTSMAKNQEPNASGVKASGELMFWQILSSLLTLFGHILGEHAYWQTCLHHPIYLLNSTPAKKYETEYNPGYYQPGNTDRIQIILMYFLTKKIYWLGLNNKFVLFRSVLLGSLFSVYDCNYIRCFI